jgi:hypothetical protein
VTDPTTQAFAVLRELGLEVRLAVKIVVQLQHYGCLTEDAIDTTIGLRATEDTIGMSMHFSDADPIAVCLVRGCGKHFHGDSRSDATNAWSDHVSAEHRADWGD